MAIRYGASALGFVSAMPSGPGIISEESIAEIVKTIPPCIDTFLLTSKQEPENIIVQQRLTGVNTIQIVDTFPLHGYRLLRQAMPGIRIIQVIHVRDEKSFQDSKTVAQYVDALLLDSGNPQLTVKELGGTGRTHNWSISRSICKAVSIPVFLAGGLNSENVLQAIQVVLPYGVDVCSGVRTDGRLDEEKLSTFISQIPN
jgi:phosphoribosylanthranilate isomerase